MREEHDLIQAVMQGDAAAFDELFARHAEAVRLRLAKIVRDASAAEDLTQEVFLRLWTKAEQYNGSGSVEHWLLRTATNLALNHLRSQRRRPTRPLQANDGDAGDDHDIAGNLPDTLSCAPDDLTERSERQHLLWVILRTLPDAQRDVLQLMLERHMDIAQIARELGIAPGTVKSRLHYARQQIRDQWPD